MFISSKYSWHHDDRPFSHHQYNTVVINNVNKTDCTRGKSPDQHVICQLCTKASGRIDCLSTGQRMDEDFVCVYFQVVQLFITLWSVSPCSMMTQLRSNRAICWNKEFSFRNDSCDESARYFWFTLLSLFVVIFVIVVVVVHVVVVVIVVVVIIIVAFLKLFFYHRNKVCCVNIHLCYITNPLDSISHPLIGYSSIWGKPWLFDDILAEYQSPSSIFHSTLFKFIYITIKVYLFE